MTFARVTLLPQAVALAAKVYQQDELSPLNKAGDVPAAATIGVLPLPNRTETLSIFPPHSNKSFRLPFERMFSNTFRLIRITRCLFE
jgi:hypothetical protein